MKKNLSEFTGTFFMAIVLGISANYFALGAIVACFTLIGYQVSGAHYNPAITFALLIKKQITVKSALGYFAFQFAGGALAVVLFYTLFGRTFVLVPQQLNNILKPLLIEIIFSFFIVLTYLRLRSGDSRNIALGVGFAVMASGLAGASLSGGAFNPGLGLMPALIELFVKSGYPLSHTWIYGAGPIAGSIIAVMADTYVYTDKINNDGKS